MPSAQSEPRVVVIGVGNECRRDDAFGLVVARRLKEMRLPSLRVVEESGEAAALMEAWTGADVAIIVDAVFSGSAAGTIFRFDLREHPLPGDLLRHSTSTHALGVANAVGLASALDRLPPRLIVYGIEGQDFTAGAGLSSLLANLVGEVTDRVRAEVRSVRRRFHGQKRCDYGSGRLSSGR